MFEAISNAMKKVIVCGGWFDGICDRILENLPFGHKQIFWENYNKKFKKYFFKLIFYTFG